MCVYENINLYTRVSRANKSTLSISEAVRANISCTSYTTKLVCFVATGVPYPGKCLRLHKCKPHGFRGTKVLPHVHT